MRPAWLVPFLVVLAGCTTPLDNTEPAERNGSSSGPEPAGAKGPDVPSTMRTTVVDWTGSTSDGVRICGLASANGSCIENPLLHQGEDTTILHYSGSVVELTLQLDWEPTADLEGLILTMEQDGHATTIESDGPTTIVLGREAGLAPDGQLNLHVHPVLRINDNPVARPPVDAPTLSANIEPRMFTVHAIFVTVPNSVAPTP